MSEDTSNTAPQPEGIGDMACPQTRLQLASRIALIAHEGQTDKAGNPYYLHVFAVRDALAAYDEETQIAGVLHDLVEDTKFTLEDLRAWRFSERVVSAVDSVTRRPGETYMELIHRAAAHPIGRLVKLADNLNNSDPDRLALLPAEQAASLSKRYARARVVLNAAIAETEGNPA